MAWRQITRIATQRSNPVLQSPGLYRFFSKSAPYLVKVGIPEFLNGIGKGVEAHVPKLETEIGDIQKLLVTRTLKLKKLGIPCKHLPDLVECVREKFNSPHLTMMYQFDDMLRKLILGHAHKFRLGLWRPRVQPLRAK